MSENPKKTMVNDLTVGSVPRLLFAFAAPLFVSNALQAVYNIVDMIVVGQVLGGAGMSAVSTGGGILQILNFIVMGFSSAGQIIIARDVGSKNMEGVRKTIGTMFSVLLTAALLMSIFCYLIRETLLELVNTPFHAHQYTMDYTMVCLTGLVFIYGYNIVSAIMRGMGDSKRPFMFVAIASIINIVLDILFVVVFRMEVIGAALATVIGQSFSFLYALTYLYRHRESFGFDFKPRSFIPHMPTLARLSALGIPMAMQSAAITISMTVVTAWVNAYGVTASALSGILHKMNAMMGIMTQAITTAAGSMVGQNLGARKYERIPKILGWAVSATFVIQTAYVLVLISQPKMIIAMFTADELVMLTSWTIILPSILNSYGAVGRTFAFSIINGSGNSRLNLLVAILDGMIGRVGLAYLLGRVMIMGPRGFWIGDAIAGYAPMLIGGVYYFSGMWKRKEEKKHEQLQ